MSRLERLVGQLRTFYGLLPTPPVEPFQLFVWEVLSVHSMPHKRDRALAGLKRARALTPDAMHRAPQKVLEDSVRLAGAYLEQRMQALREGVDVFRRSGRLADTIQGPLPAARRALKGLPRMGEAGIYRMLLFAADHPVLPVDARVSRAARRLGYGAEAGTFPRTARTVREAVAAELPARADAYRTAFIYLEHHGAATCTESDPHCGVCPLLTDCPHGQSRT
jgi:endonuclease-3